jgi:protein-S-isoprenylcysteine O-methyltransferase Ste14
VAVKNRPIHLALEWFAMTAAYGALLFLCAGTARWPAAWAYLAVITVVLAVTSLVLTRYPDLVAERQKPPADAKRWDKPLVAVIGVVGPLALVVVCGLDRRFRWSPPLPDWWIGAGLVLVATGGLLTDWAMSVNRFFSALVRIQRDRGHRVVEAGPYRLVRHPGYLGSIVHMPGAALALGSLWALSVVAVITALTLVRTGLEDRTLRTELEGYDAYARRVRYRLVPGIW